MLPAGSLEILICTYDRETMLSRPLPLFLLLFISGVAAFFAGRHFGEAADSQLMSERPRAQSGSRILTISDAGERSQQLVEVFAELGPPDLVAVKRDGVRSPIVL